MSGLLDLCVFELAGHKVAIPLENAREFQRLPAVFPLPGAPPAICGVVDLRGDAVPVLDFRRYLGFAAHPPQLSDYLLFADCAGRRVALWVDAAIGRLTVPASSYHGYDRFTSRSAPLNGIVKLPDGLILIHDLKTVFTDAQSHQLQAALENYQAATPPGRDDVPTP